MTEDILSLAQTWLHEGRKIALASVTATWGSSPRPAGSQMLIDDQGNMQGSVSGGCVEGAVVTEAQNVMETQIPVLLEFGVTDEQAWQVGLACGGKLTIYIEPIA